MADHAFLSSEQDLDAFLLAFQTGALPKDVFTHAAHVAMAACYCLQLNEEECRRRVRHDIRHFNESVGGKNTEDSGYHETITMFWLDAIRAFLRDHAGTLPRLEAVRLTALEYERQVGLAQSRYSFDLLKSREARAKWILPDLPPDSCAA